jgi:hypothetical protein
MESCPQLSQRKAKTMPTTEDELRDVVQARLYGRQARWEMPKAVAMILLASAAISASARLADWLYPPRPQLITVHIEGPLPH